jgi:hypothetical protein
MVLQGRWIGGRCRLGMGESGGTCVALRRRRRTEGGCSGTENMGLEWGIGCRDALRLTLQVLVLLLCVCVRFRDELLCLVFGDLLVARMQI